MRAIFIFMNKFCFILLCILCLATIPVYAEDNFWDKPPHPNGVYGYDEDLPDLLNIKDMTYDKVRLVVMATGWSPEQNFLKSSKKYDFDDISRTEKTILNIGYHELQSCSGGQTYCLFVFQNKNGDQLRVITKGEDWDYEPPVPAKVVGYRFLSKN
ncbi:MAG TPA: hypothetical protein PLF01_01475 [Alphaproteobacteria bacterium]|nr:hypothetical protein [Alphaproteobacteria bacterium]